MLLYGGRDACCLQNVCSYSDDLDDTLPDSLGSLRYHSVSVIMCQHKRTVSYEHEIFIQAGLCKTLNI